MSSEVVEATGTRMERISPDSRERKKNRHELILVGEWLEWWDVMQGVLGSNPSEGNENF